MSYIPEKLRREVNVRAMGRCEYCRLHEDDTVRTHEIDHIRAEKHKGTTTSENLCLSCFECNRYKGTDLSSVDPATDEVETLFHPRRDIWTEHFILSTDGVISPLTAKGRVTAALLDFNDPERVGLREMLIHVGEMTIEPPTSNAGET